MDHVRAMKKILLVLLCFVIPQAFAAPVVKKWISTWLPGQYFDTADAACRAATGAGMTGYYDSSQTNAYCGAYGHSVTVAWRCADGTAPDTSKPADQQCKDPLPTCVAGEKVTLTTKTGTGPAGAESSTTRIPLPESTGGCAIEYVKVQSCISETVGTTENFYCTIEYSKTGELSTAGNGTNTSPDPAAADKPTVSPPLAGDPETGGCPAGTVRIGTDSAGTPMCAGTGTNPAPKNPPTETTKPPTTTTNPDGSSVKTEVTERLNSDGSKTTTTRTTTTAADGTQTVSESTATGPTPSGGTGKADPSKEEMSDFCKKNPTLNVCRNSTVAGACAALSCEGDAISCSIAKTAAEANCREKTAEDELKNSAQKTLGDQVLAGNDPLKASYPSKTNGASWSMPGSLDQSGWLGGGSCFTDKSFTVQGQTVVIPFSKTCDYLIVLRYVAMIIAMLVSFKLLSGTILLRT